MGHGVAAHKAGDLQAAASFYDKILKGQPTHAIANHNLGLIAISNNRTEPALQFFKIAVRSSPKIEKYWVSYITALVAAGQVKEAKQAAKKARRKGLKIKNLDDLMGKSKSSTKVTAPPNPLLKRLLDHYQQGQFYEAEQLATTIQQEFPTDNFSWKILAAIFKSTGRYADAVLAGQKAVEIFPDDAEAHYNLGNTFKELEKLEDAEDSYKRAAILKPDYAEAHSNLGTVLQALEKLDEAERSYAQAIALNPNYAEAHCNLGVTLRELGRVDEAKASCERAIALNPDHAEAHYNFGVTLKKLGKLIEAEASCRRAIALKPDLAEAHSTLAKILYESGHADLSLESIGRANCIAPETLDYELIMHVLKAKKYREKSVMKLGSASRSSKLSLKIGEMSVDPSLVNALYDMSSRTLDETKDGRYGSGFCSPDFRLFENNDPSIQRLARDLTKIMTDAVQSDIYIYDSFFNILKCGGGTTPHRHLNTLDKEETFNLSRQKYSLVYYLRIGDQQSSEPGTLKLLEPEQQILPREGMTVIMPASRPHFAIYNGTDDRVMVGVNFYSL